MEQEQPAEPVGAVVFDPFSGSGTTALVASRLGRRWIGFDLSESYCERARRRIFDDAPLLAAIAAGQ
jgi:DNA modification methylase